MGWVEELLLQPWYLIPRSDRRKRSHSYLDGESIQESVSLLLFSILVQLAQLCGFFRPMYNENNPFL